VDYHNPIMSQGGSFGGHYAQLLQGDTYAHISHQFKTASAQIHFLASHNPFPYGCPQLYWEAPRLASSKAIQKNKIFFESATLI
jgi:hypothetical protein